MSPETSRVHHPDRIKEVPREEWDRKRVEDIVSQCSEKNTVDPSMDAMKVMARMNREGVSRLLVTDRGHLEGIVTLRDLFAFISMKLDLEGEEGVRNIPRNPGDDSVRFPCRGI